MTACGVSGLGAASTERIGLSEEEVRGIIPTEVTKAIKEVTPKLFVMV